MIIDRILTRTETEISTYLNAMSRLNLWHFLWLDFDYHKYSSLQLNFTESSDRTVKHVIHAVMFYSTVSDRDT